MVKSEKFEARLERLYSMMEYLDAYADEMSVEKHLRFKLQIAVEEALVNIIQHGHKECDGTIELTTDSEDPHLFFLQIRDHGIEFNPLTTPKRNLEEIEEEGGRGIPLILGLFESVEYNYKEKTNILTLKHPLSSSS
jgi:serine/threonine-protein kinase RsbW